MNSRLPAMAFDDEQSSLKGFPSNRSNASLIDIMQLTSSPYVSKCETNSGRKAGYYTAILSRKNGHGIWSVSTAKQFASSFLTSTGSDFIFTPRMHKVSTGSDAHLSE